jgi:hypothetical protein
MTNCVVLGDFNAHHTDWSSRYRNARGIWLEENKEPLIYSEPVLGTITSVYGSARSDHLLFSPDCPVEQHIIHDRIITASDHYPITFSVAVQTSTTINFERINFGAMRKPDKKRNYSELTIQACSAWLSKWHEFNPQVSQKRIDTMWQDLKETIKRSLIETVGMFQYRTRLNNEFNSPEITETRSSIQLLQEELLQNPRNVGFREAIKHYQRQLEVLEQRQKDKLYRKYAEALEEKGNAAFLRMINCKRSRQNRSKCKLKRENLETDKDHYRGTFGALPEGQVEQDDKLRETMTDPLAENSTISEDMEIAVDWLMIRDITKWMQAGKAPGCDDIPAEAWKVLGLPDDDGKEWDEQEGHPMYHALARLFQECVRCQMIPTEWTKAIIIPVWKKKGSETDIRQYRPIALTVVCRRIYEQVIQRILLPIIDPKLQDTQGGFRPQRSTLQQVAVLEESMVKYKDLISVFLDIAAAYDTVNRTILWRIMQVDFGLSLEGIRLLRSLFDYNKIQLRVHGKLSSEVACRRGLLQGSSLSPILFNCYINSLIRELNEQTEKINLFGLRINNLFFADDGALLATNEVAMQKLLDICHKWSLANGIQFAPTKCEWLSRQNVQLHLGPDLLPRCDRFKYLGIWFSEQGIDWKKCTDQSTRKCREIANSLRSFGFNGHGWTPKTSIIAYKAFLRPIMEYGIALQPVTPEALQSLERTQMYAIKLGFSVHARTSNLATLTVCGLPSMEDRNAILNALHISRIHNSEKMTIPVVNLYWKIKKTGWQKADVLKSGTLIKSLQRNIIISELSLRPDAIFNNLVQEPLTAAERQIKNKGIIWNLMKIKRRTSLEDEDGTVAGALLPDAALRSDLCRPLALTKKDAFESPEDRRNIILWMLGRLALHQFPCNKCGQELSRAHAVQCSGAEDLYRGACHFT